MSTDNGLPAIHPVISNQQGRTLDEILEQEKPKVVAKAKEKAAYMLHTIQRAELLKKGTA